MQKKICAIILMILILLGNPVKIQAAEAPAESELYAKSAVLMDAASGRVLYAKNADCAMANASTTKILTCIVILENCALDGTAEVTSYAASQPRVRLGMRAGQKFTIRDLLYGLMLESFNDCAVALAEYAAGSVEGFAMMMNDKAVQIGCTDSYFITPNGLDAKDEQSFHHTTATDLAKIMRYCITQSPMTEAFLEITRTPNYAFSDLEGTSSYSCANHNAFLQMMEGALTGKTGFTGNAGYCYIGALKRDDRTYIVALLACGWPNNKTYKWSDTKKLMQYGIDTFFSQAISSVAVNENDLDDIIINHAKGTAIGETVYGNLKIQTVSQLEQILLQESEQINVKVKLVKQLDAPVEQGTVVGNITYYVGNEVLRTDEIIIEESVEKIDWFWCWKQVILHTQL